MGLDIAQPRSAAELCNDQRTFVRPSVCLSATNVTQKQTNRFGWNVQGRSEMTPGTSD